MSGSTILVVDDEPNIVQLARLYLRNEGYQVETAANGREALEKVRQTSPSLILLDLMMPIMDGWEVCKQLRKTSDVPIIMLTARDDDIDKVVGRLAEHTGLKSQEVRRQLERADQLPAVRSDIRKGKALEWLVEHVEIVDEAGQPIEASDLLGPEPEGEGAGGAPTDDETEEPEG